MPRGPTLRIVSVNDVYSLENLPRLKTLVARHRTTQPADAFIAVLAGDFLAPSLLSSLDGGRGMMECLNAVGITHLILGNHEDDVPLAALRARIAEFRGTWLSTNLHGLADALKDHQILEVQAPDGRTVRVGLIGVVMTDPASYRASPFGGATLEPANACALRETARLLSEGCATVIPITHQTIPEDQALARAESTPRYPLIVGGHEHTPYFENIEGTMIVKTGTDAFEAAIMDLEWPEAAPPRGAFDTPFVRLTRDRVADYADDADLRATVEMHMAKVHALDEAVLLTLAPGETLSSVGARKEQTSLGTLICTKLRDTLRADACIFNGGGIRGARIYQRHLTYGDVRTELPFDNEIVVVRMSGEVLASSVKASRSAAPNEFGGFLQVDDRLLVDHDPPMIDGAPLDPTRIYEVAMVRELFRGMDHIAPLVAFGTEHPERIPPAGSGRETKVILVEALSVDLFRKLGNFEAVDVDHDGSVGEADLTRAVATATGEPVSKTTVDLIMNAIDKNHDHAISHAEADAVAAPERKPR